MINWRITGIPGMNVNVNTVTGKPPLYIVCYDLQDDPTGVVPVGKFGPEQHLARSKKYHFNVAIWSLLDPPQASRLNELLKGVEEESDCKNGVKNEVKSDVIVSSKT